MFSQSQYSQRVGGNHNFISFSFSFSPTVAAKMTAQGSDSRCRLCGDKKRCCRDPGRLLVCLNLCLVVAGIVYVSVLHREVSGLRTQLGRYNGAVVTPARQTGNGRGNVRVVETDEAEEDEEINGDGRVTEVSDTIAVYHRTCVALRVLYNVYYITSHCVYYITFIILRSALF